MPRNLYAKKVILIDLILVMLFFVSQYLFLILKVNIPYFIAMIKINDIIVFTLPFLSFALFFYIRNIWLTILNFICVYIMCCMMFYIIVIIGVEKFGV